MRKVVADLLDHGQDVQLHLHPVWLYYRFPEWMEELPRQPRPGDSFTDRTAGVIADWLRDGAAILSRWTGRPPVAFRSGNLNAGRVLYQGMREAGLALSSNIGVALSTPAEPELAWYAGLHRVAGGVTEVPVTSYRRPLGGGHLLLLTITGSSFLELRAVLERAAHAGIGPIVVLLHPHGLRIAVRSQPDALPHYRPDPVRQSRLERLCAHLARHPERFRVTTFAAAAKEWQAAPETANPLLSGSVPGLATRLVKNRLLPRLRGLPQ